MLDDWNKKYLRNETPWDRGEVSPFLSRCLPALQPASRILVPGCGRGHEVIALARAGHLAVGIDLATEALRQCREQLAVEGLVASLKEEDVLSWGPDVPADAVYEQTCLCALEPLQWETYAGQLHRWIRQGGWLFAAFKQTGSPDGPPFHCDLTRMREIFPDRLWHWLEDDPFVVERSSGPELCFTLRRL